MGASYWLEVGGGRLVAEDIDVTYNLGKMLRAAGWPGWDFWVGKLGEQAAPLLRGILLDLVADPVRFQKFNPGNGWGDYEGAVAFVLRFAVECAEHPEAAIGASL